MVTRPTGPPSKEALRDAFVADLAASWVFHRRLRPKETPYAFVLWGVESPIMFSAHVLTEEGLNAVAQSYVRRGHDETVEEARESLRWSVADAPNATRSGAEQDLPTVQALFEPHVYSSGGEVEAYGVLAEAAIEALRQLDAQGFFGKGRERERLTLVIITEGTDADWTLPSAKRLNPPAVYERLETAFTVPGVFARCDALAPSPRGGSLYAGNRRGTEPGGVGDEPAEVVAFDLRGGSLARRWTQTLGQRTEVKAVAPSPDGGSVYAAWIYSRKGKSRGGVTRFARDDGRSLAQCEIPWGAWRVSVSADGRQVAVRGGREKSVLLFDADLRPLPGRKSDDWPADVRFLRDGRLAVVTASSLRLFNPAADEPPASFPFPGSALSTDDAEQLLAVSPVSRTVAGRDHPGPLAARLLRLPSLELVRTIELPGHDPDHAVLSGDGRLLAFEAEVTGRYRGPAVVVDTATGRVLARRKFESVDSLTFLRDGRTLAVGTSGFTTGEAIELWAVPG